MRRVLSLTVAVFGLVAATPWAAPASATDLGAVADPIKGEKVCTVKDERLAEISGLVATGSGYIVVNDGSDSVDRKKIFFLDAKCKLLANKTVSYPTSPSDTEDAVLSPDGKTLWVGDIGDNQKRRSTIALWKLSLAGGKKPELFRLRYPQGQKLNAEALLINGDGTPIIITKEASVSHLYTPSAALVKGETGVPLQLAGEFKIPVTTTSNPLSMPGRLVITGGAVAPGGAKVALRTYADAFEWDVQNGDVVGAVTKTEPRITGLPDETFGEALTYSTDGAKMLTISELLPGQNIAEDPPVLLRYEPTHNAVKANSDDSTAAGGQGKARSWTDKLSLQDITYGIGAVGLIGLLMVGAGIIGIARYRRRPPSAPVGPPGAESQSGTALAGPVAVASGGAPVAGAVYGGVPSAGGVNGGLAGGPPASSSAGSGVYGGRRDAAHGRPGGGAPGAYGAPAPPDSERYGNPGGGYGGPTDYAGPGDTGGSGGYGGSGGPGGYREPRMFGSQRPPGADDPLGGGALNGGSANGYTDAGRPSGYSDAGRPSGYGDAGRPSGYGDASRPSGYGDRSSARGSYVSPEPRQSAGFEPPERRDPGGYPPLRPPGIHDRLPGGGRAQSSSVGYDERDRRRY